MSENINKIQSYLVYLFFAYRQSHIFQWKAVEKHSNKEKLEVYLGEEIIYKTKFWIKQSRNLDELEE